MTHLLQKPTLYQRYILLSPTKSPVTAVSYFSRALAWSISGFIPFKVFSQEKYSKPQIDKGIVFFKEVERF